MTGTAEWDVLVVGAGISGLAAAHELAARGRRVLVVDRRGVGLEQSQGLGRIFRIAHGSPRLCGLALEARTAWKAWEERLGAGRLLGEEGLVTGGPRGAEVEGPAMSAAGAPWEPVDAARIRELVPDLAPDAGPTEGILDPLAGSIRVRRTLNALADRLDVRVAEVVAVADRGDHAVAALGDGTELRAGRVLVCAGIATPWLARTAGLALDLSVVHHVRLTYRRRHPERPTACLAFGLGYALPLGTTGLWGLGLEDDAWAVPVEEPIDGYLAEIHRQHARWVPEHLPGLHPAPVDEVRCVAIDAPWLDEHEDGFAAVRAGRVVAFTGSNLMKFGPLLGDRLARTMLDEHEGDVHPDLRPVVAGTA